MELSLGLLARRTRPIARWVADRVGEARYDGEA